MIALFFLGANSTINSKRAARKFAKIVQKLGFKVRFKNFKVLNMVGVVDVGFPIKLEQVGVLVGKKSLISLALSDGDEERAVFGLRTRNICGFNLPHGDTARGVDYFCQRKGLFFFFFLFPDRVYWSNESSGHVQEF